jgi:hypothetical protein
MIATAIVCAKLTLPSCRPNNGGLLPVDGEMRMTTSLNQLPNHHADVPQTPVVEAGRAQLHHVKVQALQGEACVVICADGLFVLPVAAGCLLQPNPGDTVLASISDGDGYIIQVLVRHAGTPARLRVQGDAELRAQNGQLTLAAHTVDLHADTLSVRAERLIETGERRESNWTSQVEIAHHQQSFITRRDMHIERSVRRVAEHEEQSAGSVRLVVAQDWRVRANTADLLGGRRVKVDAETVQLG